MGQFEAALGMFSKRQLVYSPGSFYFPFLSFGWNAGMMAVPQAAILDNKVTVGIEGMQCRAAR